MVPVGTASTRGAKVSCRCSITGCGAVGRAGTDGPSIITTLSATGAWSLVVTVPFTAPPPACALLPSASTTSSASARGLMATPPARGPGT